MIHVGIAQGSGFAPRSVCGAGSDVLSVPRGKAQELVSWNL